MKATAVIGSGFGDEGKGALTDYLATPTSMVVRYNGGAQASHTVVRNGKRHIFRHVGSGALQGAPTFLSEYFINNPILYFRELEILRGIGVEPLVYADPGGMVTTPWDMMINTMLEENRGGSRHGSCGVGIHETMNRHVGPGRHPFRVMHLFDARRICESIMRDWVPNRLREINLDPSPHWHERLTSPHILDVFVEECEQYLKSIHMASFKQAVSQAEIDNLVFEGAQGLLLDQDHYWYPHVTHSKTGLHNVLNILNDDVDDLDVVYVTRAYATRHGAGPFPGEHLSLSYEDATNVPNRWQGSLRFGHLDLSLLAESVRNDMAGFPGKPILAVTCLDQVSSPVEFWQDGKLQSATKLVMVRCAWEAIEAKHHLLVGFGPTAKDICRLRSI